MLTIGQTYDFQIKKNAADDSEPKTCFIIKEIGQGASACVYKIKTSNNKIYAYKRFKSQYRTILLTEELLSLSKQVSSQHLVNYHGYVIEKVQNKPQVTGYVMELAETHLQATIQKHNSIEKKIAIVYDILLGLQSLHDNQSFHGDLKPLNVLGFKENHFKLSDFGSASNAYNTEYYPPYDNESPERIKKQKVKIEDSQAIDLFALGLIICELFTGKKINLLNSSHSNEPVSDTKSNFLNTIHSDTFFPDLFFTDYENKIPAHWNNNIKKLLSEDTQQRQIAFNSLLSSFPLTNNSNDSITTDHFTNSNQQATGNHHTTNKKTNKTVKEKSSGFFDDLKTHPIIKLLAEIIDPLENLSKRYAIICAFLALISALFTFFLSFYLSFSLSLSYSSYIIISLLFLLFSVPLYFALIEKEFSDSIKALFLSVFIGIFGTGLLLNITLVFNDEKNIFKMKYSEYMSPLDVFPDIETPAEPNEETNADSFLEKTYKDHILDILANKADIPSNAELDMATINQSKNCYWPIYISLEKEKLPTSWKEPVRNKKKELYLNLFMLYGFTDKFVEPMKLYYYPHKNKTFNTASILSYADNQNEIGIRLHRNKKTYRIYATNIEPNKTKLNSAIYKYLTKEAQCFSSYPDTIIFGFLSTKPFNFSLDNNSEKYILKDYKRFTLSEFKKLLENNYTKTYSTVSGSKTIVIPGMIELHRKQLSL